MSQGLVPFLYCDLHLSLLWFFSSSSPVASLGGGDGPPRVTPSNGVTPELNFLCLNLQGIVDKRRQTGRKGAR